MWSLEAMMRCRGIGLGHQRHIPAQVNTAHTRSMTAARNQGDKHSRIMKKSPLQTRNSPGMKLKCCCCHQRSRTRRGRLSTGWSRP